jgi:hypothetical protein
MSSPTSDSTAKTSPLSPHWLLVYIVYNGVDILYTQFFGMVARYDNMLQNNAGYEESRRYIATGPNGSEISKMPVERERKLEVDNANRVISSGGSGNSGRWERLAEENCR